MKPLSLAILVVAILLTGCSQKERPPGQIGMTSGHAFDPVTVTIDAGETVTWINDSSESHTVTAFDDGIPEGAEYFASGGFSSEEEARDEVGDGLMKEGETFEVTFEVPGTYRYLCIPHESHGMTGTVTVR
ncbi:MAG: copper-binding protein [Actinobacteria bacterium]|nr:copper-binding protein [Actinomycetota bacterium]